MTAIDRELLAALETDLPCVSRPFAALADRSSDADIGERTLIDTLRRWLDEGVVRRYGALVAHRLLGYHANAMIVGCAPDERVEEIGQTLAGRPEVSHCYQRPPFEGFPYNVYAMVHGRDRRDCERIARLLATQVGFDNYRVLFSTREFKKTSPTFGQPGGSR